MDHWTTNAGFGQKVGISYFMGFLAKENVKSSCVFLLKSQRTYQNVHIDLMYTWPYHGFCHHRIWPEFWNQLLLWAPSKGNVWAIMIGWSESLRTYQDVLTKRQWTTGPPMSDLGRNQLLLGLPGKGKCQEFWCFPNQKSKNLPICLNEGEATWQFTLWFLWLQDIARWNIFMGCFRLHLYNLGIFC